MPTSDDANEQHRWWLLRYGPRHDSGVLYQADAEGEVWASALAEIVPFLVTTGDFAPADMQYRMYRQHLCIPESGLYGQRYNVDAGQWVIEEVSASDNVSIAEGLAHALREGGTDTPTEMRGRWQRQTSELIAACASLDLDPGSAALLADATRIATEDGWL